MNLARTTITTPLGEMLALASDEGLCALEFVEVKKRQRPVRSLDSSQARLTRLNARLRRWFPPHEIVDAETPTFARTRTWLSNYFDGADADVGDLPLDMHGAGFEKRVWQALLEIPAGETMSYGAIARKLGSAGASRAVGAANGANPIAIIVPCHRVIGSTGSLTGYGGGLDRKTWLLDHERRWRTNAQSSLF
jgi:methylated-DNA-[protein]-cysteine S-methyltransferase